MADMGLKPVSALAYGFGLRLRFCLQLLDFSRALASGVALAYYLSQGFYFRFEIKVLVSSSATG